MRTPKVSTTARASMCPSVAIFSIRSRNQEVSARLESMGKKTV